MSRDAVRDQLVRGALTASDRVSREGGEWARLDVHGDFRAHFIPGTPAYAALHSEQTAARRTHSSGVLRRRGRRVVAVFAALAGVAVAVGAARGGWFVVPEPTAVRLGQLVDEARSSIAGSVAAAVDQDVAARSVLSARELPGAEMVADAELAHPGIEGPAALHIALGRAALWEGTRGSADEARVHFERALVLAPWDAEAASGLAQALASLYDHDPALGPLMAAAAERADAAAPDSIAGLQARAAVARASGSEALALDLSSRCGAPPARAGLPGAGVDLWCALTTAALEPNPGALAELEARHPGVYAVRSARMAVAHETGDLSLAIALGELLSAQHPQELLPQGVLADVYVEAGRFDEALGAATRAASLDPRRLRSRRLRADLLLKHAGKPREALAEFESVIAHTGFARMPERAQVYADAAAAALAVGASDRAVDLADLSLEEDRGNPPAVLHKARAQVQRGDGTGAETTLRGVDLSRVKGHQQARYHVGAARVYLRLGRDRMAVAELVDAREVDPHWPVAALDTARVRLRIKDLMGAIEMVEAVAYMDRRQEEARSPLHRVWYPPTDWAQMRTDLERGLIGDVRFEARGAGVLGVVSWAGGMAGAQRQLQRAVRNSENVPSAHAALAQIMMERGDIRAARFHADALLASRRDKAIIRAIKGRAMIAAGDVTLGMAELTKAIQDDAGSPGVRRHAALARQQQGDILGAVAAWRDLQRLSPEDVSARAAILALERAGR